MAEAAPSLESTTKSAGSSGNLEDIALIEEHVDPGLVDLLAKYEPTQKIEDIPVDTLNDRFTIHLNQPIPDFDNIAAKAYAATDSANPNRPTLAMVCDPNTPYRGSALEALKGVSHQNICSYRDGGSVKLSDSLHIRQVLFVDRTQGQRLSAVFKEGKRFHERRVIDQILTPIIDALNMIHERGVCHGRINPDNIFLDQHIIIGECVSEPQGLSQDPLYEPIERLMSNQFAKGAPTPRSDAYAIGMLACEALFGLGKLRELGRDELIQILLEKGSYHAIVANKDTSEAFNDFFRGIFNENKQERWGLEQISNWLTGKRFNLIPPSLPSEATRPFEFNEREYFSCRSLANGMYSNWGAAVKQIRKARLDRWLEMSVHKSDMAEQVARIIRSFGGDYSSNEKVNNEMLSRILVTLDPNGPIRCKSLSMNVDGLGLALIDAYKSRDHASVQIILDMIEADLPTYWADMLEFEKTKLTTQILWILQRVRMYLKHKHIGFGLERLIYDFNPSLPCQSELMLPYHATTAEEALIILDNLAKTNAQSTSLADRHLIAFLASKTETAKEVEFKQLSRVPTLHNNQELIALRLISLAQDKKHRQRLVGLATWAAMRVDKLIDKIHSRKLRKKIRENLKAAAKTGMVSRVLAVLVENDLTREDYSSFIRANRVYLFTSEKINNLNNQQFIDKVSQDFGGRISVFVAYMILSITIFMVIDHYHY